MSEMPEKLHCGTLAGLYWAFGAGRFAVEPNEAEYIRADLSAKREAALEAKASRLIEIIQAEVDSDRAEHLIDAALAEQEQSDG